MYVHRSPLQRTAATLTSLQDDASSGIEYEHLSVASSVSTASWHTAPCYALTTSPKLWEDDYSIASNHGSANSISTASTASQFPTDIWSIETRKRILGHRTYHAHAVPNTTISNLVRTPPLPRTKTTQLLTLPPLSFPLN